MLDINNGCFQHIVCFEAACLESKRRVGFVLEAARGPRCCVVFSKCLEPRILVFEDGQESALHRNPQLLCQLCVHLQVCRQHSEEGLCVSFLKTTPL